MSSEAVELCELIERAFGPMQYPGDDNIVYDNSGYDLECVEIKEALKGKHWRDISCDTLDQLRQSLGFLSPQGFRFYLPAFLRITVTDYRRADVIPDMIMVTLTPPRLSDIEERQAKLVKFEENYLEYAKFSPEEWRQINAPMKEDCRSGEAQRRFDNRVSGFTPEQSMAIRRFLEYMRDVHGNDYAEEAQRALDRYWRRF